MTSTPTRRPLPALVFLLALTLLTALVWWRVLHRDSVPAAGASPSCSSQSPQSGVLPRPSAVTVSVLNSTQRTGLAKATATALGKDGFDISGYANDPKKVIGVAEIRYAPDAKAAATLVSYYVPGAKLVELTSAGKADVVVSLGSTYKALATPTQVQAKMAATHLSFAPTPPAGATAAASC